MGIDHSAGEVRAFERSLGRELLRRVSRTLYLSLRPLPAPVRGPMSLGYLLARTSDTLADSGNVTTIRRIEALRHFQDDLVSYRAEPGWVDVIPDDAGERELLERWPQIMAWFWAIDRDERRLIRELLSHIVAGQTEDVERAAIESDDALDRYTYQVAGSVGEFWTRLCAMKFPRFARLPVDELVSLAVRFGKGLQLVNIVRDIPKDAMIGRSYLPGVSPQATPETRWAGAHRWVVRAREFVECGRHYSAGIRGIRMRMAVNIPLELAQATLDLIESSGASAMVAPVKISRRRVRWLMVAAAARAMAPTARHRTASRP
jgi:farnesyl-diphosphate farnesyltransferase